MLTQVLQTTCTQNLVISCGCFEIMAEEFTKIFNTHAKPLLCPLKLFFDNIHVYRTLSMYMYMWFDINIPVVQYGF